jgi:hypothetical protein
VYTNTGGNPTRRASGKAEIFAEYLLPCGRWARTMNRYVTLLAVLAVLVTGASAGQAKSTQTPTANAMGGNSSGSGAWVRVAAKAPKKIAPATTVQTGSNAPPAVALEPSPVGPIIIPVGPDHGPAAPPRPSKPPRPPNTCIGQVCPLPIPLPN